MKINPAIGRKNLPLPFYDRSADGAATGTGNRVPCRHFSEVTSFAPVEKPRI